MMIIRPININDKQAILDFATKTGTGFTSLPQNEERLLARLTRVLNTWTGDATPAEQGYLFVLEDTDTQKAVGICGIEVAIGLDEPWYNFHVGTQVHASKELGVYTQMKTLVLTNNHTGYSELCTLFLDPDYRENMNGHLLSKSRLMFIAQFQDKFSEKLIAEMRGMHDENDQSPFWESLGRHFFAIEFSQADYLTGIGQKAFIAELMPKHALYVDFLTDEAKAVMAEVHPSTAPARRILENEGMRYEGYIDIFDAGPTLEAYTKDLRVVRDSQHRQVRITDPSNLTGDHTILMSNDKYQDFRAVIGEPLIDDTHISISLAQAEALKVQDGDPIRFVQLHKQENNS
ncbi:arginine N-succinyltransferase [Vibrio algicola]|uniref:Arginine N-succinyltransferase n=1 Tax=Vibrio algicola TaxID=2662262 RepID=A0A5Q0TMV3_9VIBR|nr:arginine N-succinyltransferase [Vibrio algicola]